MFRNVVKVKFGCPYETSNFSKRCLSRNCPKQVVVDNYLNLYVRTLKSNPTYLEFMTFMIGLHLGSFTFFLRLLKGGQWGQG